MADEHNGPHDLDDLGDEPVAHDIAGDEDVMMELEPPASVGGPTTPAPSPRARTPKAAAPKPAAKAAKKRTARKAA